MRLPLFPWSSAFEPGTSGLPYYCTPPVCVPDVIGGLALWRHNNNKKKKRHFARRLVLGGGVPSVGSQEELRGRVDILPRGGRGNRNKIDFFQFWISCFGKISIFLLSQRESCKGPFKGAMQPKCLFCRKNARSPVPAVCRVWVAQVRSPPFVVYCEWILKSLEDPYVLFTVDMKSWKSDSDPPGLQLVRPSLWHPYTSGGIISRNLTCIDSGQWVDSTMTVTARRSVRKKK